MSQNDLIEVEYSEFIELCIKARMWDFYSEKAEFVVDGEGDEVNPTDKIAMLTNKTVDEEDEFFESLDAEFEGEIEEECCADCEGCNSCEMSDVEDCCTSCTDCNCGCEDNEDDPKDD